MHLFRKLSDFPDSLRGGALTIGNFDGVHQGHASLVERLKHHADQVGGAAIVFTFDPHPVRLLRPEQAPPPLTWTNRKAQLLFDLGVEAMVAFPTTEEFLQLSYRQFFDQVVVEAIGARAMIEGPNFYFGRNREGDVSTLKQLCGEREIELEIADPMKQGGEYISSSRIRKLVVEGQVVAARDMLSKPYRIRGMVTHGAARGARIGFPTANLEAIDTLIPKNGVYAGFALISGKRYPAAINIGPNPTFGELAKKVEVHVLDFAESIYGLAIEVDFIERLRDIRQFDSTEQLQEQLKIDIDSVRKISEYV